MWMINAKANLSSMQTGGHWWHFLCHQLSSLLDSQRLLLGVCEILSVSALWEFSWRSQSFGTRRRQLSVMFLPCWCGLWDWNCKRERLKVHLCELHLAIFLPLVWYSLSDCIQYSGSTSLHSDLPDGMNVHCGEGSLREKRGGGGLSSVALWDDEH